MIKRFNIVTKKTYEKNGEEKAQWNRVGTLVHFPASERGDEGYKLELNMFPDTQFYIFEDEPRQRSGDQGPPPEGEVIEAGVGMP